MSFVWKHFAFQKTKSKIATCNVREASASTDGGNVALCHTANSRKHLEKFHRKDDQEFLLTNRQRRHGAAVKNSSHNRRGVRVRHVPCTSQYRCPFCPSRSLQKLNSLQHVVARSELSSKHAVMLWSQWITQFGREQILLSRNYTPQCPPQTKHCCLVTSLKGFLVVWIISLYCCCTLVSNILYEILIFVAATCLCVWNQLKVPISFIGMHLI